MKASMQALLEKEKANHETTKMLYNLERQHNDKINSLKMELLNSRIKSLEEQNAILLETFQKNKKND
jgi:hypothetical protein